jgi:hypothetical protein
VAPGSPQKLRRGALDCRSRTAPYTVRVSEGRLLITRFGPWSGEKCVLNAQDTYDDDLEEGRYPRYGVSVFGGHMRRGESLEELLARICTNATVRGDKVAAVWADELRNDGWEIYPGMPPDMHYLIGRAGLTAPKAVESLALVWANHKVKNPVAKRR